jgi:hypothetical protein
VEEEADGGDAECGGAEQQVDENGQDDEEESGLGKRGGGRNWLVFSGFFLLSFFLTITNGVFLSRFL